MCQASVFKVNKLLVSIVSCSKCNMKCVFVCRYMSRPVMSGPGLYDPTTIMNADILAYCQKEGWCKLAFYLLSFFYYLYGYVQFNCFIKHIQT